MASSRSSLLRKACSLDDAALSRAAPTLAVILRSSSSSREERRACMALAQRLADQRLIDGGLLASLSTSFARQNRAWFGHLVDALPAELVDGIVHELAGETRAPDTTISRVSRLSALVASLAVAPRLARAMGQSTDLVLGLCDLYDTIMPKLVPAGTTWTDQLDAEPLAWLKARLDLVEGTEQALAAAYLQPAMDIAGLSSLLMTAFDLPSDSLASTASPRSLISLNLLGDLEGLFSFSSRLEPYATEDDATLDYVIASLKRLVPSDCASGLDLLGAPRVKADKGKGKASSGMAHDNVAEAFGHVMAILPDQDPAHIRRCLEHPHFRQSPTPSEALVSAVLENNLPPELAAPATVAPPAATKPARSALADVRGTIFEGRLDPSLAIKRNAMPPVALDKAIDDDLRASILAFAEADAAFERERDVDLEDYDPEGPPPPPTRVRIAGVGDDEGDEVDADAEEDDDVPVEADVRGLRTPRDGSRAPTPRDGSRAPTPSGGVASAVQRALERAYLTDPATFEASARARSSPARAALREATGMASDLIESWAKMLERDPNKDRILARHSTVFEGNERGAVVQPTASGSSSGGDRARGRGRGGGAPQRGRGGRGRSDHVRRQRGHDRKVAKMGGPG